MRISIQPIFRNQTYNISHNRSESLLEWMVQKEELNVSGSPNCCHHALLTGMLISLMICLFATCFGRSCCCAFGFFSHLLMIWVSLLGGFQYNEFSCRLTCIWEFSFLVLWALVWYWVLHPGKLAFNLRIEGVRAAKSDYENRLSKMAGPLQECYESEFFFQKCEEAINQVTADHVETVTLEELVAAGQQVTLDPHFLQKPLRSIVTRKSDAIMMLKWASTINFETGGESVGSRKPAYYHYNVLQLPLNCELGEARQQYDALCTRWSREGTEAQIQDNLSLLAHSFEVVAQDIHARLPQQL